MVDSPQTPNQVVPPSDDVRNKLTAAIGESLAISAGQGSKNFVSSTLLTQHDRFANSPIQLNSEMVGLTFFTKPRLNTSAMSLKQDRMLALLNTIDGENWMFALRCNLDTIFSNRGKGKAIASLSPWFNDTSPFNIPASNMLAGISGWPDFNVETETTESGTFAEDMTLVRGSDFGRRTYDLSCTFRDIQGGFMMGYFYYWLYMMALQMEGGIVAYPEDREANRLNYTVSIYRFLMDPSMRYITGWAKATGCYPVNVPIGDKFNYGPGDSQIHTSQQFTIPFKANVIKYMDPQDLADFNTLVLRYGGDISSKGKRIKTDIKAGHNFAGLPWIDLTSGFNELMFLARSEELVDPSKTAIEELQRTIQAQTASLNRTTT